MAEETISATVPFVVARCAKAEGLDAEQILRGTGLSLESPPRADDHIAVEHYFNVWRRAMSALDAAFPLRVARAYQLEDHEVFGFLAISCTTLGEAYARTAQYRGLYASGQSWDLAIDAESARLYWRPWKGDVNDIGYRAAMDFAVADMVDAINRLAKVPPTPLAVRLAHPAPADPAPFAQFYGVAPQFGTQLYELHYTPDLLAVPINTSNSRLRDYFDEECKRQLEKLGPVTTATAQVRKQLIATMDGGDSSIENIAKLLGMSSRSLQRKLGEENTSFNDLLADVRTEFAKRYLTRGTITASEVAYLLGFTEPPAFFKAFKRWTGLTPREFQLGAVSA